MIVENQHQLSVAFKKTTRDQLNSTLATLKIYSMGISYECCFFSAHAFYKSYLPLINMNSVDKTTRIMPVRTDRVKLNLENIPGQNNNDGSPGFNPNWQCFLSS